MAGYGMVRLGKARQGEDTFMIIVMRQIKAGRALLGWRQADLAKKSGVSLISIQKIEVGAVDPKVSTMRKIQIAFEKAGLVFIGAGKRGDNGEGEGVRLR
jgi:DNA-binding XRE family transcriptional regulator